MKYIEFRKLVTSPIFTPQILRNLGAHYTPAQLTMWQSKGYITKLRGGLYTFSDNPPDPTTVATFLVSPSYLSLSYALSHYSMIPEAVFSFTSVTTKGTRNYTLPMGNFTYQHIPASLFFGYNTISKSNLPFQLAEPEKALLDFFYLNPNIQNNDDLDSLRLNLEIINWDKLTTYSQIFDRARLHKLIRLLRKNYVNP